MLSASTQRRLGVGRSVAVFLIRVYRVCLSPLKPACCRFSPTCSAYAETAFRRFGFWRGLRLTLWRVLRCHPFYRGALHDPVPTPDCKLDFTVETNRLHESEQRL